MLLEAQIPMFQELVDENIYGPGLILRFREGEMATRDLTQVVGAADIADSGSILLSLRSFIEEMKVTRLAFSQFSVTVGGAVDM